MVKAVLYSFKFRSPVKCGKGSSKASDYPVECSIVLTELFLDGILLSQQESCHVNAVLLPFE